MTPTSALYNAIDCLSRYAISSSQVYLGSPDKNSSPNFQDLGGGKFRNRALFASRMIFRMRACSIVISRSHSSFGLRIRHIFKVRAKKHVVGVDTRRIIPTGAIMANFLIIIDGSMRQNVGHSRRLDISSSLNRKLSVPIRGASGKPRPTSIWATRAIHFRPKSLGHILSFVRGLISAFVTAILPVVAGITFELLFAIFTALFNHDSPLKGDTRNLGGSCLRGLLVRLRVPYKINRTARCIQPLRRFYYSIKNDKCKAECSSYSTGGGMETV